MQTQGNAVLQPARCPPGDPCRCPCLNPQAVTYVQPLPPASCAPKQAYRHPRVPVAGTTVYKNSYPGVPPDVARLAKPDLCRPDEGPIKVPGVIDGHTTTSLSFQYPQGSRTKPCRPFGSNLMGKGPMQDFTTQKVDYPPKPYSKRDPYQEPGTPFPDTPMEGITTNRLSFAPPEAALPAQSMKPVVRLEKLSCPVDCLTTHKMSFHEPPLLPKEDYPWAQKGRYHRPCVPFAGFTTYRSSYIPPGQCVPLDSAACTGGNRSFKIALVIYYAFGQISLMSCVMCRHPAISRETQHNHYGKYVSNLHSRS